MVKGKKISLFWWSEIYLTNKEKENYGDLIGKYLVERISQKSVAWIHPGRRSLKNSFKKVYFTVGSILAHVQGNCIVWGSGIISREDKIKKALFLAVRGPHTRNFLLAQGHVVPEVYGDPALLMPKFFSPEISKKYKLGVIPHFVDYDLVCKQYQGQLDVIIIDLMTNDVELVTQLIVSCDTVISSSLHGLIVSHAYQVPAAWVRFSDKIFGDGVKYQDYFESVGLVCPKALFLSEPISEKQLKILFDSDFVLPNTNKIRLIQDQLLECCPFKRL
jgi:pyruvyltransferase